MQGLDKISVYLSLRFSESRDKAHLLDDALRKRGINAVMADPQSKWDRHTDMSSKVSRLLTEVDLVVIIASPLYGKKLRSHFGSFEEIKLIQYFQKPVFVIKACHEITNPLMLEYLDSEGADFEWSLGEPGEPPLPGGVIEMIVEKLNEVRGVESIVDEQSEMSPMDSLVESELSHGRGRAAIAKAAKQKQEAEIRAARLARTTKTGALSIMEFCPDAMTVRGAMCFQEYLSGSEEDSLGARAEAVAWFRQAAENCNHRDAKLFLASCHYEGADKDHEGAVKWLTDAMEGTRCSLSKEKSGRKSSKKKGNEKNSETSELVDWKGASGEMHVESITNLGESFYHGEGVKKDRPEAAKLYRQAAELGFSPAQANLAEMLSSGEGVVKDLEEAAKWFAAAATGGLPEAQFGLAHCYERGEGVDKNLATAAFWYEMAASQGHKRSVGALEHLESKMQAKARGGE